MRSDRIEPSSMPTRRPPETCDPASHDALARFRYRRAAGRLAPPRRLRRCRTPIDSADAKCFDRWSGKRQSLRRPKRAARRWTCWPTLSRGQFSRGGRRGRVSGAWVGTRQAGRRYPCAAGHPVGLRPSSLGAARPTQCRAAATRATGHRVIRATTSWSTNRRRLRRTANAQHSESRTPPAVRAHRCAPR